MTKSNIGRLPLLLAAAIGCSLGAGLHAEEEARAGRAVVFSVDASKGVDKRVDYAALQAAPVDIGRLTDQVMHSIDQRLIASRERFGKR